MADEMMAGEQSEDAAFAKILELCQSGDPAALGEIAQIVQQLQGHNQEEEQEMGGQGQGDQMAAKVMQRIQSNRQGGAE